MTQNLPVDGGMRDFDKVIKVCVEKILENCKDEESLANAQFKKFEGKIRGTREGRSGIDGNWLENVLLLLERADQDSEKHSTIFRKITVAMTFGPKRLLEGLESLLWTASSSEHQFVLKDLLLQKGISEEEIPMGLDEEAPVKLALLILFNNVALKCLSQLESCKVPQPVEDPNIKILRDEIKKKDAEMARMQKQFKELQESFKELKVGLGSKGKNSSDSENTLSDGSGESEASKNETYKAAYKRMQKVSSGSVPNELCQDIEEYIERKRAQKEMYNKDRRPITMEQVIRMVCDTSRGLIVYDILGNEHMVTMKKSSSTRVMSCRIKRGKGPDGANKAALSIMHDAPKIFPQSSKHFDGFIREQMTLASNARRIATDRDLISSIDDKVDTLNLFKDKFLRRIQLVMGEVGAEKVQHVSLWSVLLHFLIVIWNTAITSDRFSYLVSTEVDSRWEREFSDKCVVVNGQTFQGIEESLKFLLYSCQNPKCGAFGMPANFCLFCTPLTTTTSSQIGGTPNNFTKKEKEAAYQAWKLTIAAPQSTHMSKFLLAFPKFVSTASAGTSNKVVLSAEAAWSMLASNQKLITAPRVNYN